MAKRRTRAYAAAAAAAASAAAAPIIDLDAEQSVGNVGSDMHRERRKRKRAEAENEPDVFEIKEVPPEAGASYYRWCVYILSQEFPRVTISSIKQVLRLHKRLGPAYRAFYQVLCCGQEPSVGVDGREWLRFNKAGRSLRSPPPPLEPCPFFERELALVKAKLPPVINLAQDEPVSQDIECGCCFAEFPFEQMVQCADGHLFCLSCLQRHVEQATFGGGQSFSLPCMDTAGCTELFPWSEVERALSPAVLEKYEKRVAEESIARAKLEGLVYCPSCSFPCEVDPGLRNLDCPSCHKLSCVKCKEPDHLPLTCEEVEKKSETTVRRHIEELMTKALIRECGSCKAEVVKQDGCNKIICRCSKMMCYVCRATISNYNHFCQHPREPGMPCTVCNKCGLWDEEKSESVVKAAKEAALKEAAIGEPSIFDRRIGPDEAGEQPRKSRRLHRH